MLTVNPQYALAQLERALITAEAHPDRETERRALARVEAWIRVIEGMRSGALQSGSRTPTAAPSWATLEVIHGGFATGELLANGPLLAHEEGLAKRLGIEPSDRLAFALHFLSDMGRAELHAMLASGCFRIDVPEEGALLSAVALLAHGASEQAAEVIEAIAPYFDRLRFYPQPETRPNAPVSTVHVATVGEMRAELARLDTPLEIQRMNEALTIWAPLTDRAVDLFLETVEDRTPCRIFPLDWHARAAVLLADHARARSAHRLCTKPHRPKENLAILMRALTRIAQEQAALSKRELGLVRVAIEGHVKKHGAPGSERRQAHRTTQARIASLPTRGESAQVLTARLESLPADQGLDSLDEVGAPMPTGPLWPSVRAKLERCLEASMEELIARGVLTSAEALAEVLPQISAHVRALGFTDPAVARLYAAIDAAFRRRRSLLLLNYQSQVKLEELPWVAALEPLRTADANSKDGANQLFSHVTSLAIESFPQAVVPNPLLGELRELAKRAGLEIPLVD